MITHWRKVKIAFAMTDNQSVDRLQEARRLLFKIIYERKIGAM